MNAPTPKTNAREDDLFGFALAHRSEDGMISLVSVVVLLFIMVLIGLVGNAGYAINQKIEVQNSADAAAYTGAVWMARGMNVLTATNHLIGEIQSLVVLHAAIGGEELENKEPLDPNEAQQAKSKLDTAHTELQLAYEALYGASLGTAFTPAYADPGDLNVGEEVQSGATYRAAMTDLKNALRDVYIAKFGAQLAIDSLYPPAVAAGEIAQGLLDIVEGIILTEYLALKMMETFAKNTIPLRDLLFDTLLPGASAYERATVEVIPFCAAGSADAVAQRNRTSGAIYPSQPKLPVIRDKTQQKEDGDMPRSQLVRATYPWVKYDRTPILQMTKWMIFSHTHDHYINYTNRYTLLKSKELYNTRDFAMYVMTEPAETKGSEPWTDDSRKADRMFTLVGFAHRPSKTPFSPSVFGVPNRDGIVSGAQAIFYNANSQNPGSGGTFQPEVGWDTLNWAPPVTSSGAYEHALGPDEVNDCPRIKLNWQAKLVPVSRLKEAAESGEVGSPFAPVLSRLNSNPKSLLTH